ARALKELAAAEQTANLPPSTLVLLGTALLETGAGEQAVVLLRQAQRRHPGDFWINFQLAHCLAERKPPQWEEAIRFYTAALALRPQSPVMHVNVGVALSNKGQLEEAIAECRQAIRLDKDFALAHSGLGVLLRDKGQLEEAIAEQREAVRLDKDDAVNH